MPEIIPRDEMQRLIQAGNAKPVTSKKVISKSEMNTLLNSGTAKRVGNSVPVTRNVTPGLSRETPGVVQNANLGTGLTINEFQAATPKQYENTSPRDEEQYQYSVNARQKELADIRAREDARNETNPFLGRVIGSSEAGGRALFNVPAQLATGGITYLNTLTGNKLTQEPVFTKGTKTNELVASGAVVTDEERHPVSSIIGTGLGYILGPGEAQLAKGINNAITKAPVATRLFDSPGANRLTRNVVSDVAAALIGTKVRSGGEDLTGTDYLVAGGIGTLAGLGSALSKTPSNKIADTLFDLGAKDSEDLTRVINDKVIPEFSKTVRDKASLTKAQKIDQSIANASDDIVHLEDADNIKDPAYYYFLKAASDVGAEKAIGSNGAINSKEIIPILNSNLSQLSDAATEIRNALTSKGVLTELDNIDVNTYRRSVLDSLNKSKGYSVEELDAAEEMINNTLAARAASLKKRGRGLTLDDLEIDRLNSNQGRAIPNRVAELADRALGNGSRVYVDDVIDAAKTSNPKLAKALEVLKQTRKNMGDVMDSIKIAGALNNKRLSTVMGEGTARFLGTGLGTLFGGLAGGVAGAVGAKGLARLANTQSAKSQLFSNVLKLSKDKNKSNLELARQGLTDAGEAVAEGVSKADRLKANLLLPAPKTGSPKTSINVPINLPQKSASTVDKINMAKAKSPGTTSPNPQKLLNEPGSNVIPLGPKGSSKSAKTTAALGAILGGGGISQASEGKDGGSKSSLQKLYDYFYNPKNDNTNTDTDYLSANRMTRASNNEEGVLKPNYNEIAKTDKRVTDVVKAIANNEQLKTGEPYSFSKWSDSKLGSASPYGRDLGKYQITSSRLAEKSKDFLGRKVSDKEFLSNPSLQDKFIEEQTRWLIGHGLTDEEILAVHRHGWGDLSRNAIDKAVKARQDYSEKGIDFIRYGN